MKHFIYYSPYVPIVGLVLPFIFLNYDTCIINDKHCYVSAIVQVLSVIGLLIILSC